MILKEFRLVKIFREAVVSCLDDSSDFKESLQVVNLS